LSLDHPRRIFRRSLNPDQRRLLLIGLLLGGASAGVSALPWHLTEGATPPSRADPEVVNALPDEVAVVDGATLKLGDRVVRLQNVQTPPRGQFCPSSNGARADCGEAATNLLARLVKDSPVQCRLTVHDAWGRPFGICNAHGTQLKAAVFEAGLARADHSDAAVPREKDGARSAGRGAWSSTARQ